MTPEFAIEIIKAMIFQAITLATPILTTAMATGLGISLFQSVTSIHEQTLTFVPKALGVLALIVVLLPWIIRTVTDFTRAVIERMPQMAS